MKELTKLISWSPPVQPGNSEAARAPLADGAGKSFWGRVGDGLRRAHKKLLRDTLGVTQHRNLVDKIAPLLGAEAAEVLDIGCGDGVFSSLLIEARPGLQVLGAEIKKRPGCRIECISYDGGALPFPGKSFDYALLVNMLHHADDPSHVLSQAMHVARRGIIVKDHYANNRFDYCNLVAMEWIGNCLSGINQPYGFVSESGWKRVFEEHGLKVERLLTKFVSYNRFLDIFFGRNLHFIALLTAVPDQTRSGQPDPSRSP